jgi:hypothetical protein
MYQFTAKINSNPVDFSDTTAEYTPETYCQMLTDKGIEFESHTSRRNPNITFINYEVEGQMVILVAEKLN